VAEFKHDVSLSFAGAQREYVREVAAALALWGASIFYDDDFQVELWGDDLNEALQRVYGRDSRFVVMFVSREYEATAFPTAERRAAFAGAMHGESIVLPVRFDDAEVPGLNPNVVYLNASHYTPRDLAEMIAKKLQAAGVALRMPVPSKYAAVPRPADTADLTVAVTDAEGAPIDGAEVAVVGANGNVVRAAMVEPGNYACAAPARRLLRVWVGHPAHTALVVSDVESSNDIHATLGAAAGVGSAIFFGSTGYLPTVKGRFAPIIESERQTYVYIDNAAANGGPARPFHFTIGEPFEVEDIDASVTVVTFVDAVGNGSLIEYVRPL
jgi:hypothetical protein